MSWHGYTSQLQFLRRRNGCSECMACCFEYVVHGGLMRSTGPEITIMQQAGKQTCAAWSCLGGEQLHHSQPTQSDATRACVIPATAGDAAETAPIHTVTHDTQHNMICYCHAAGSTDLVSCGMQAHMPHAGNTIAALSHECTTQETRCITQETHCTVHAMDCTAQCVLPHLHGWWQGAVHVARSPAAAAPSPVIHTNKPQHLRGRLVGQLVSQVIGWFDWASQCGTVCVLYCVC